MNQRIICSIILLLNLAVAADGQQRCGIAKDLVVQAREAARPGLSVETLRHHYYQLERATSLCYGLGDAFYYRHLFAKQIGEQQKAAYFLSKARESGSEALSQGSDPFAVAPVAGNRISVSPVIREKWALVVGIGNFRNNIRSLAFPAKDARDFANLLKDSQYGRFKPENLRLLTDGEATTEAIKEGLNWLARMAAKDDLVTIFVSSHGSPRESDTAGVSYVVSYDTDASNSDRLYATALPMIDLVEAMLTRIKSQRAVLFLDTCFSGVAASGISRHGSEPTGSANSAPNRQSLDGGGSKALATEGAGVSSSSLASINYAVGRVVITASQSDERSWESEKLRNGFFTYYLIEALKQGKGASSIEQVYAYLKDRVARQVQLEKGMSQMPVMSPIKPNVDIYLGVSSQSP
jgi:Caspase domain